MSNPSSLPAGHHNVHCQENGLPPVFCWTKMGAEAGQPLQDIIRRKELERQSGAGVFAWGIGNSIGAAIKYAKSTEHVSRLETLFTPMKAAPRAIDASPSSILLWLGYHAEGGQIERLPAHMLVISRGHSRLKEDKRGHYALICQSHQSLLEQKGDLTIDSNAARNLVSTNPVGASQVTSVVRYRAGKQVQASYPVLFRAMLTDIAFVRLAMPVALTEGLFDSYCAVRASRTRVQWEQRLRVLCEAAMFRVREQVQGRLL